VYRKRILTHVLCTVFHCKLNLTTQGAAAVVIHLSDCVSDKLTATAAAPLVVTFSLQCNIVTDVFQLRIS
jgi:uncharacterized membrane protein YGL010W